jgi:hypothetical protein
MEYLSMYGNGGQNPGEVDCNVRCWSREERKVLLLIDWYFLRIIIPKNLSASFCERWSILALHFLNDLRHGK